MYGVLPTVLSLEGSRRFSASCSSTLPTLPASVIDIVLVPTRGPTIELSMPSLLWPQVRDVRENMSLRQRSFQWFLEKAIEERSVEFGCVDGEAEEGGRSGGNGAHLGLSFRQGQPRNRRSMRAPFQGLLASNPPIFCPRLISAEELLSSQKWDSYPQCHHTEDVPASHQVRTPSPNLAVSIQD